MRLPNMIFATLSIVSMPAFAAPIDTGALLGELIDLRRLAQFPDPFYKTVQFSSYDRQSKLPGGPLWFANSDGFGSEPIPNFEAELVKPGEDKIGEYLVCDIEGPGAIVRLWSAAIEGTIRMYLDGAAEPIYDGPAMPYFTKPYDTFLKAANIDPKLLDGTLYQRNAAYCPFPFAKHLRIVWRGDLTKIHFYEVQVRRYDAAAQVTTFTSADLQKSAAALQQFTRVMRDPDTNWNYTSSEQLKSFEVEIQPGETKELTGVEGAGAIERLTLKLDAKDRDSALRQTVLRVFCDAMPNAVVEAPVGDFFGAAPGINPYVSLPFTVKADGTMISRYFMPFAQGCSVRLENMGDQPVTATGGLLPVRMAWDPARSMHFRARWRIDRDITGSPEDVKDMPYVVAGGAGVYVGSAVFVLNPNPIPGSGGNWWGEGDEKIFTDDDTIPSIFGTGSEDYFNYAWSAVDIFQFPYCGQPRNDGPGNRGFVANHRWHILDPLPFKHRMQFYMELFPHERNEHMGYARIGYHYARPGLMDDFVTIGKADVVPRALEDWQPAARGMFGATEFYDVADQVRSKSMSEIVKDNLWAGAEIYVWTPQQDGDELVLGVPVREAGKYAIHLCVGYMPNAGKFSAKLDGNPVEFGAPQISLNDPDRTCSRVLSTKNLDLEAGVRQLTLHFEGGSPRIPLDFIGLQKRQ